MSSIIKEEDNPCNKEEDEDITCTDDMNNMHITCTEDEVEIDKCSNCGKEGSDLNVCNKCKAAKYCNAACKKKHRSKHKKKCERRVAELYDEQLFKPPPLKEDCPICMLPLPSMDTGSRYSSCCGKEICNGCVLAVVLRDTDEQKCAFCRTPAPCSDQEVIERIKKRIEAGDAEAIFSLGCYYVEELYGLPRDHNKALELWHRAGELGFATAYYNIGNAYDHHSGRGVERDNKKADHYYELAAMQGSVYARHNLGCDEDHAGNWDRAIKHYMIAAGGGDSDSVKRIQQLYRTGHATKEDYTNALQAYQTCLDEIRSEHRDRAAAADDQDKYY